MHLIVKKQTYSYILVLIIALIPVLPFLGGVVAPVGDSLEYFHAFKYIYSSFYYYDEFPVWNFGVMGGGLNYFRDFITIGPPQALSLFLGKIFHVNDPVKVFSLSIYFQQVILTLPFYLILKELKINLGINLLIIVVLTLMSYPYSSYILGYKIFTGIPLFLWALLVMTKKTENIFFLALLVLTFHTFGHQLYTLIPLIYLYILLLILFYFFYFDRSSSSMAINNPLNSIYLVKNLAVILLITTLLFLVYYYTSEIIGFFSSEAPGRRGDGTVSYKTFLTYGGVASIKTHFLEMLSISNMSTVVDIYVGVFLVAIAISFTFFKSKKNIPKEHKKIHLILLLTLILVFLFISGNVDILNEDGQKIISFHSLAYYLPGMNLVRHISLFGLLAVIPFLIISALALMHLEKNSFVIASILGVWIYVYAYGVNYIYLFSFLFAIFLFTIFSQVKHLKYFILISSIIIISYKNIQYPINKFIKDDEVFKALSDMPKANFSRQRNIELSDSLKRYIDLDKENISQRVFYDSLFSAMNEEVCFNPDHKFIRFYFLSKSYKTLRTKWRLADNISNKENKKKQVFFCDQKLKIAKKVSTGCGDSLLNDGYLIQEGEGFGCLVEGQKGLVKVNDFSPNSLSIETSGTYGDDAYLVYGDGYSKVWEVLVDGIPSNIAKINYAYKGVGIDSGSHMVNFKIKNHLVYLLYFKNLLLACLMIVAFLYFTRRVNK